MASQPSHRLIGYYATAYNELPFVLSVHNVSHFCCSRSPETDSRRLVSQEELKWLDKRFWSVRISTVRTCVPTTVTSLGNARPTYPFPQEPILPTRTDLAGTLLLVYLPFVKPPVPVRRHHEVFRRLYCHLRNADPNFNPLYLNAGSDDGCSAAR